MRVAQVLVKKLCGLIFGLIGFFKRLVCRIKRGRKNSGNILPVTTDHIVTASEIQQSVPSNNIELESWDSWGGEDPGITTYRGNKPQPPEPEPESEIDFFTDMTPAVKSNPKILIRKKDLGNYTSGLSSRLAMTSDMDVPLQDGELGTWEDSENAWGEEVGEDLSWEAEAAIKEKRRLERDRRQLEAQRKRQEKEALRLQRKDGGFAAVKLS